MIRRSELRRSSSLARSWFPRSQTGMPRGSVKPKRSVGARKQDALRRSAYIVVDERSGAWCEVQVAARFVFGLQYHRCMNAAQQHHHRLPRRMGGSTDPTTETAANIVALCAAHHDGVESNRTVAYELGLLVRAGHDPAATPVLLHVGWTLLDTEGNYAPYEGDR